MIFSSCSHNSDQGEEIARVDDQVLTSDEMHRQIDTAGGVSEMQMRMFARQWVNSEILYQEAKREGLDHSESVLRNLEDAKRQLSINALLEKEVFTDSPRSISNDEIASYFKSHLEEFALRDDIVEVSLAVFSEREPAATFRAAALQGGGWDAAIAAAQKPQDEKSTLITKADSTFYTQETLFPAKLWKVTSALGPGEVSFPVKTSAGYFVILLLGSYSHGATPPIEYAEDAIRGRLVMEHRQERFTQYLEATRKKHTVQINLSGAATDHDTLLPSGE